MTHIDSISNGLGAQSLWLLVLAARGEIPARVSITADTGWENDKVWSTGERTSSREYFDRVIVPYGEKHGIDCRFVRANKLPGILEHTRACVSAGKLNNLKIPLFGADGGRLSQPCTGRWKVEAINQELRRLGATTARTAQGIHWGEAARRVKGLYVGNDGRWAVYRTTKRINGVDKPIRWLSHYYPLVDLQLRREHVVELVRGEGLPYLLSSECDGCPHKDFPRWSRTAPEVIDELAALERCFGGEYFFTDQRIPLKDAIEADRARRANQPELFAEADFGCRNDLCGV